MALIPFNESKDKITERELVFDIVERESLGVDLVEKDNLLFKAKTKLTSIFKRLIYMLPTSVVMNFYNIRVGSIIINEGESSGAVVIKDTAQHLILLAQSEQTGMDVKECISMNEVNGGKDTQFTVSVDTPYNHIEHIKIYAC